MLRKNVYQTYKEDVYNLPIRSLKTDGYYVQVGELPLRVSYRDAIIFYGNGYAASFRLLDRELDQEIKTKITSNKDTLWKDLNWWKVQKDSLIIEHYFETKRRMTTWNAFQKGSIHNDSTIELHSGTTDPPVRFQFIETDDLPIVRNTGRYLKKEWYRDQLHKKRKSPANDSRYPPTE